ncbi:MAG: long-chain fatty acid--CoA ligase [bacterium]|nr:long-chain fatty acid--CoA ligase [bacterium]
MIGRYRNSTIPLEKVTNTIGSMVLERAVDWPGHPVFAYREETGYQTVTWHQLLKDVVALVDFLHAKGIKKGDHVAVLSPNCYRMLVWELGVLSLGAVSVPIFAGYDTENIDYILNNAEPRAIFVNEEKRRLRLEACAYRQELEFIVTGDDYPDDDSSAGYIPFKQCTAGGSSELFIRLVNEVKPDDICFIQYTSGTTGNPKGVMLMHSNILSQQKALKKIWNIPRDGRFLSYLPWHHSFGGLFERFTSLYHGATLYLEDSLGKDIQRLILNWSLVKPTQFFSVPKIFKALVTEARLDADIKKIIFHPGLNFVFTAAAPLPRDCGEYFNAQKVPVLEGWGLTETSPCVTLTTPDRKRFPSYVGEPLPGCEILTTEEGEILVKGPNIMKGYYRNPERTAQVIDHYGWFHTGDLGEITDYGLKLSCRIDGLFKLLNGEKVSSMQVENAITISSQWISHALAVGAGENYVGALLFPNFRQLEQWAEDKGETLPQGWDLSKDNEIQNIFRQEIETNMQELNPKYIRVKAFVIVPETLSIEKGELTPSMKVIRHFVLEERKEWVHSLFSPHDHPEREEYVVRLS